MSVVIRNAQRAVAVRRAPLRRAVCALREALGASRFDVALVCAGNGLMRRLPRPRCRDEYNLGDIFLGVEYIEQQCRRAGGDFESVLTVTAAHGLCHLLGYQHNTKSEWQQMYRKEEEILEELNRLTGASLRPLTAGLF
ncbi:YBEY Endoribonuclease, partial [Anseranas semipalmata]|nr:YBEY Endoribonuclease [Anseranas semipalmata]